VIRGERIKEQQQREIRADSKKKPITMYGGDPANRDQEGTKQNAKALIN